MKFVPRRNQAVGRVVVKRLLSSIVRPDETKGTTKFVLIDAVGPEMQAAGINVGDVVLAEKMGTIMLDGGYCFRPLLDEKDIKVVVTDVTLSELVVQNDSGSEFVSFDDKNAAKSICEVAVSTTNGSKAVEARA